MSAPEWEWTASRSVDDPSYPRVHRGAVAILLPRAVLGPKADVIARTIVEMLNEVAATCPCCGLSSRTVSGEEHEGLWWCAICVGRGHHLPVTGT